MNKDTSPFSHSRYEHDGLHLYYIQKETLSILESDSPIIITGSRGTGKTTLLKAVNWKEQKNNQYLQKTLSKITHRDDYIGIYLKLPKLKIKSFQKWESRNFETYTLIFSFYIELVWIQELISAFIDLKAGGYIVYDGADELECVDKINKNFFSILNSEVCSKRNNTLSDINSSVQNIREFIEDAAIYNMEVEVLYEKLSGVRQYGEFSNYVSQVLSSIGTEESNYPKRFKVCFDECESLSAKQLLVLNTLLRICEFPVFYIFSYIGKKFDSKKTLIPNLTNQKADVQIMNLDDMDSVKFEKFADGVSSERIAAWLGDESVDFKLKDVLDKGVINELLYSILGKSESPKARELINLAKKNSKKKFFDFYKDEGIPIYQTYLVEKLHIDIESSVKNTKDRRWQESKEIRKRMVAAYLSICTDFKVTPLYAYSFMVYRISDISIRDYIWQLDEIFKESQTELKDFIKNGASVECQDRGIKKASEKKLYSIQSSSLTESDPVAKLIMGFGKITEIIQTRSVDCSHLKSSERGIFTLATASCEKEMLNVIQESADAGFVKILEWSDSIFKFRIHNSLAPIFGFSYRGAYYDTPIKSSHIKLVLNAKDTVEIEEKAKNIAESIYKLVDKQGSLF